MTNIFLLEVIDIIILLEAFACNILSLSVMVGKKHTNESILPLFLTLLKD
jgi:hypothetical protein